MATSFGLSLLPRELPSFTSLAVGSIAVVFAGWLWLIVIRPRFFSPYRHLPGPPHTWSIRGNLPEIFEAGPGEVHKRWIEEYGTFIRYTGFLGKDRLLFTDNGALTHMMLSKPYVYAHPQATREQIAKILGKGLLFADGDDHKRQRRIMTPAFGPSHVNALLPVFLEKGRLLREKWIDMIESETPAEHKENSNNSSVINVSKWFSRATLDVIGSAAFGHEFGSLKGEATGLAKSFDQVFSQPFSAGIVRQIFFLLATVFPVIGRLPTKRAREMKASRKEMQDESQKIMDDARERLSKKSGEKSKDLIALLLKANAAESNERNRMTDGEVMGQMTTFLLAGHETTSTSLSWTLLQLSKNKDAQNRLREEALKAMSKARENGAEELTASELDGLPYLEAVTVGNSFKLNHTDLIRANHYASMHLTIRECYENDVIPLNYPITMKNGQVVDHVPVSKGTTIFVPILPFNTDKTIWGSDADKFRPERWIEGLSENTMNRTKGGFTTYARLLTFGGGARSCIGYRFSLLELKAILFDIIQHLEFHPRDETTEIIGKSALTTRPFVKDHLKEGSQLPLRVTIVGSTE